MAAIQLKLKGIESYGPSLTKLVAKRGKLIEATEALFPSYLFVDTEPDPEAWRVVNNTIGVVRLIGSGPDGIPIALRPGEVERLMDRERSGAFRIERPRRIRAGDRVQMKHGSLTGMIGLVHRTKRERIEVLLQILGSATTVTAPRDWLRLVA